MIPKLTRHQEKKINNIHDKFFKDTFSTVDVVSDFFKNHLPAAIYTKIDFKTLEVTNRSFISEEFSDRHSDLVLKAKFEDQSGYIYFLCEHQSTNDNYLGIRLLEYTTSLMKEYIKQKESERRKLKNNKKSLIKAPIVLSIIIYAGKQKYNGPYYVWDFFENPTLAKEIMFKKIYIKDLESTSIDKIIKDGKSSLAQILLKINMLKYPFKFLEKNKEKIKSLFQNSPYFDRAVQYLFNTHTSINEENILDLLCEITCKNKLVMTTAKRLEQKGILQGKKEGKKEGRKEVALQMIKLGIAIELIEKSTGLSRDTINELLYISGS